MASPVPERPVDEVAGLARLAGHLVDALTEPIHQTHQGIAQRVFRTIGPVAEPVRRTHDAVAGLAYGSVRVGGRAAGATAGAIVALTGGGRERRSVSASPVGAQALSFASGLLGDWMDGRTDDLVVRLAVTQHGRPLGPTPATAAGVVGALDAPTDRVVLLVHGLAETNGAWAWWSTDDDGAPVPTYAEALADAGWTPLEIAYNTGRPVAESGAELAALIAGLVDAWPGELTEIALVGHSMGGLVNGAAAHAALSAGAGWTDRVSHVVTLGTPHGGSWLARAAHAGAAAAARRPETRGLGTVLDLRSPGIRDLTRGWRPTALTALAATEAVGGDDPSGSAEPADEPAAADEVAEVVTLAGLLPTARHAFVASAVRRPLDVLVGDGLVHSRSATAPGRAATRAAATNVIVREHTGVGHIRLVHHPAVTADLVEWLTPRR